MESANLYILRYTNELVISKMLAIYTYAIDNMTIAKLNNRKVCGLLEAGTYRRFGLM